MFFWIAKIIAGLFGLDISKVQRWVFGFFALLALGLIIWFGLWIKSCSSARKAKLNEKQIVAAQAAIEKTDRAEMTRVLVESDVEAKQIDENVAGSKAQTINAINESKQKWAAADNQTMADELNRRAQQSQ